MHKHIKKHHRKYLFGGALYGLLHVSIINAIALKLLVLKVSMWVLAIFGVYNAGLTDIFAKMDNICIDNVPIVAQQTCERNFDTIQEAITHMESMIDPEIDTIYNAQYYGVIKSTLWDYCNDKIDKTAVKKQEKIIKTISRFDDEYKKIGVLKWLNEEWKKASVQIDAEEDETLYCNEKYIAYDMLYLSQNVFMKELKKLNLLSYEAITSSWIVTLTDEDDFILSSFATADYKKSNLAYDESEILSNPIALLIKNKTLLSANTALENIDDLWIFTSDEMEEIEDKIIIDFVSSCDKIRGTHKIFQYYSEWALFDTKLQEITLTVPLCNSYQYIDQIDEQVQKLLTHEIGHYLYYFKDESRADFENICRVTENGIQENICERDNFVTSYSQTNAEEDYAETFSRWVVWHQEDNTYNINKRVVITKELPTISLANEEEFSQDIVISPISQEHGSAEEEPSGLNDDSIDEEIIEDEVMIGEEQGIIAEKFDYFQGLSQRSHIVTKR